LAVDVAIPRPAERRAAPSGAALGLGASVIYLSIVVLLPLAAIVWNGQKKGAGGFWHVVSSGQAAAALELTLVVSLVVALINAVAGTAVAWVLVRDRFPGRGVVNTLIDLPFALPTIVAGLTLLALYGPRSPVHVHLAYTRWALLVALLFVTLPFVVRTVQPVLIELDRELEEAAASLGASSRQIFRRIVLPNIFPAILSGVAMAFARAIGEFGSVILISGNLPRKTEVASVFIYTRLQSGDPQGAAAVSVLLLVISLVVLLAIGAVRRHVTRHDHAR
jgi:sulfate transport system permease protein